MSKIIIKSKDWKIIKEIDAKVWKTLISLITESWLEVASACHFGMCWACMYSIESWNENIVKNMKTEPAFPLAEEEVMTCIAWISKENWENVILKQIF